MTESASAAITASQLDATHWQYSVSLTDTGTTTIGTFWFAWVPGLNFLTTSPSSVANPAGWGDLVTTDFAGDGFGIQWTASSSAAELKRLGVRQLYLFGSTTRGEAADNSDIDLFFDYEEGAFGLFDLMDVQEHASRILGREADVMTRDSMHKVLRPRIEASALRVF